MKGFMKVVLIFFIVLLIMGLGLSLAGMAMGGRIQDVLTGTSSLSVPVSPGPAEVTSSAASSAASSAVPSAGGNTEYAPDPAQIKGIALNVSMTELEIVTGDRYELSGKLGSVTATVDAKGIWHIDVPLFSDDVTLQIPADAKLDSFDANVGAGSITGRGVVARAMNLTVGAGEIDLEKTQTETLYMDCGVGDLSVEGNVTGRTQVKCGMGNADLEIPRPADYGYTVNCSMGNVDVGEQSFEYNATGGNAAAAIFFDIECGMGNVEVSFE